MKVVISRFAAERLVKSRAASFTEGMFIVHRLDSNTFYIQIEEGEWETLSYLLDMLDILKLGWSILPD